jgi:hypothetical protein
MIADPVKRLQSLCPRPARPGERKRRLNPVQHATPTRSSAIPFREGFCCWRGHRSPLAVGIDGCRAGDKRHHQKDYYEMFMAASDPDFLFPVSLSLDSSF